jgi:hypothetical protein
MSTERRCACNPSVWQESDHRERVGQRAKRSPARHLTEQAEARIRLQRDTLAKMSERQPTTILVQMKSANVSQAPGNVVIELRAKFTRVRAHIVVVDQSSLQAVDAMIRSAAPRRTIGERAKPIATVIIIINYNVNNVNIDKTRRQLWSDFTLKAAMALNEQNYLNRVIVASGQRMCRFESAFKCIVRIGGIETNRARLLEAATSWAYVPLGRLFVSIDYICTLGAGQFRGAPPHH